MPSIDLTEKLSDKGYCAIKVEAVKGTAITPDVFVPLYGSTLATALNLDEDKSMRGIRDELYSHFRGIREHTGEIEVLAEPVTAAHFFNMLLKKGSTSGSEPYTHPYTLDVSVTLPKSYTIEILKGDIPHRYFGVEAKSIKPIFVENTMHLSVSLAARGLFSVARMASASATTLVMSQEMKDSPTDGLTTNDTLILYDVSGGTYEEVTITTITDGTTLVVSTISGTYIAGDVCYLKKLSPSYSVLAPFTWGATEFCFGADAAAAINATHTPVDSGSDFEVIHALQSEGGEKRSGKFEPAQIIRTTGRVNVTLKMAFTDAQKLNNFLHLQKEALVIRCYSRNTIGTDNAEDAEIRVTINNPRVLESPAPLAMGDLIYLEQSLVSQYDTSDTQGFDVKIINDADGSAQ